MKNAEILYDDTNMEKVHSLLNNANNKLLRAKEYYKSDKLSGSVLINEVAYY